MAALHTPPRAIGDELGVNDTTRLVTNVVERVLCTGHVGNGMLMGSFIRQTWLLPRWIERGRVKEGNMRNFYHFANPVDQLWRDTFD